jgi:hypothetical protein
MQQEQLDEFKQWFDTFVARFYGTDDYVNAHIQIKQEHTHRVCEQMARLAQELALDDEQKRLAEATALFHDVGRFPQFAKYRTYSDRKSINHSQLSVETLRQEGILAVLSAQERQWIETAVGCHGSKCLPGELEGQTLFFARLVRDADKLDIFRIITDLYNRYRQDPHRFTFEIELPDEPRISDDVYDAVLNGRLVDHASLQTLADMTLGQIGWVYDLNFDASVAELRRQGYLERLFSYLPPDDRIPAVRRRIFEYANARAARVSSRDRCRQPASTPREPPPPA